MISVDRHPPWLTVTLPHPHRILSWTLNRPGFVEADRILWREVRNADLPPDLDVDRWLAAELSAAGLTAAGFGDPPTMLTSRGLEHVARARSEVANAAVEVVATVGLSNAERVGERRPQGGFARDAINLGTINIAAVIAPGLTDGALIEAMSLVVQARTAAVMEHGPQLQGGRATGTGTDCVAVAAPAGRTRYAGLHTALGEAIGWATYDAVAQGVRQWMASPPS